MRDLFSRVPARREYLRAPSAEFARISAYVATLALGYPEVAFTLAHGERVVFSFAAGRTFEERLAHVFGPTWSQLIAIEEGRDDPVTVRGYLSRPGFERADRRLQHLFVNRRLLRTTALAGSWTAGYSGYVMTRRQPFGVLFVRTPLAEVDPNVHPTKNEVRFRRDASIGELVRRAIRTALSADASARHARALSFAPPATPTLAIVREHGERLERHADDVRGISTTVGATVSHDRRSDHHDGDTPTLLTTAADLPRSRRNRHRSASSRKLDRTYLLATDGRALVLVDQHAAHERIAYEMIAARAQRGEPSEPLLVPFTIELGAAETERLESSREALAEGGLEIEPFGERVYRIIATPAGYGARAFDLRGYLADLQDEIPGLSARERVWATLACHSVVRAGQTLEPEEMAALIAGIQRCRNPMHCPHGRPTIVRIEPEGLARLFKRT